MPESEIEKKLKKRVEALAPGVRCLKLESPGFTGVPDRMILLPGGRVIFAELKAPGKKERARQAYVQEQLRALGFEVWSSVRTQEQIDSIVLRCREVLEHE